MRAFRNCSKRTIRYIPAKFHYFNKNEYSESGKQLTDLTIQYDNEQNEFQLQFDEQRAQLLA